MEIEEMTKTDKISEDAKTVRLLVELPEFLKRLKVQGFENGFHVLFSSFVELCLKDIKIRYNNSISPDEELRLLEEDFNIIGNQLEALIGNTKLLKKELIKNIEFELVKNNFLDNNVFVKDYTNMHLILSVEKNISLTYMDEVLIPVPLPSSLTFSRGIIRPKEDIEALNKLFKIITEIFNSMLGHYDRWTTTDDTLMLLNLIPSKYQTSMTEIENIFVEIRDAIMENGLNVEEYEYGKRKSIKMNMTTGTEVRFVKIDNDYFYVAVNKKIL